MKRRGQLGRLRSSSLGPPPASWPAGPRASGRRQRDTGAWLSKRNIGVCPDCIIATRGSYFRKRHVEAWRIL
jgi:hypothetical protein